MRITAVVTAVRVRASIPMFKDAVKWTLVVMGLVAQPVRCAVDRSHMVIIRDQIVMLKFSSDVLTYLGRVTSVLPTEEDGARSR